MTNEEIAALLNKLIEKDNKSNNDRVFVNTVISGLEECKKITKEAQEQIHSLEITNVQLRSDSQQAHEQLAELNKIVLRGNGKSALIERVNDLEVHKKENENRKDAFLSVKIVLITILSSGFLNVIAYLFKTYLMK